MSFFYCSHSLLLVQKPEIHCSFSEFFTVSNGVKQGGILSPHLFNVYMDDLSVNLNKLQIGCLYAGTIMNDMMYADDLCVFSPSVEGLRKPIVVPSMAICLI